MCRETILVVGANGQLGSSLRELEGCNPLFSFIFLTSKQLDITQEESVDVCFKKYNPKFVINCAAYTAVDKAEQEPEKAMLINGEAVGYLVVACRRIGATFFHISTDYVFDGESDSPLSENAITAPLNVYGATKLVGERYALEYEKSVVVRVSWLYSQYGTNFVKTMVRLGRERDTISVVSDQIGSPTYALDLASTIIFMIETISENGCVEHYGLFNFSNEGGCSWYEFAKLIMKIGGLKCEVKPISTNDYPTLARRPHYSLLSKSKIKCIYGVKIPDWQDSLANFLG